MDGGVAGRLSSGVRQLLLIEHADPEDDDPAEDQGEQRGNEGELH
jgi:hypothetical protein